ncbi:MAG: SIR2 family NAD-dependent protein deacylase [Hyphomonas sp.]
MTERDPDDLARLIRNAERVVVFTGAGISTESGIPDFRSPGGVCVNITPILFHAVAAGGAPRRESWNRVFNRTAGWTGAAPNAGHYAVSRLVEIGKVTSVITQNVDNLHQESGVPAGKVIEVHGNASFAKCLSCGKRYEFEALRPRWEADEDLTCIFCTGLVKSATISFGQAMPEDEMERATEEAILADLFLVLGSSLVVYPAAGLPIVAKKAGSDLAIVNREETDLDPYADLVLNTEIGPLMSAVVERL